MSIIAICSACNVHLTLGDDRAGDRFECPRCDATIKVPLDAAPPELQPSSPPKVPTSRAARREPDEEPEPTPGPWSDKRVRAGIFGGVAVLLVAVLMIAVFAFRKPAPEVVTRGPDPAPAAAPVSEAPKPVAEPKPAKPEPRIEPARPGPVSPVPPRDLAALQYNAQFLGSQGQGRRFCIIADNSGSMAGAKIADLRAQLLKTMKDLNADSEFYIYCFSSKAEPMPHPVWLRAGAPEVETVRKWVEVIRPKGGTQPTPAFEAAFRLSPPPDVIFFMTDGIIPATVPDRVVALNSGMPKTVVNTIMFANPAPKGVAPKIAPKSGITLGREEEFLKKIAEQNGGTFTRYVPKE